MGIMTVSWYPASSCTDSTLLKSRQGVAGIRETVTIRQLTENSLTYQWDFGFCMNKINYSKYFVRYFNWKWIHMLSNILKHVFQRFSDNLSLWILWDSRKTCEIFAILRPAPNSDGSDRWQTLTVEWRRGSWCVFILLFSARSFKVNWHYFARRSVMVLVLEKYLIWIHSLWFWIICWM